MKEDTDRRLAITRSRVRGGLLAVAGLLAFGAIVVVRENPPTPESYYPKCVSYRFTSTHCPGCGTARALHSLLNLRVAQAFAYNPLGVALIPLGAFVLVRSIWYRLRGRTPGPLPGHVTVPIILAVAFVL